MMKPVAGEAKMNTGEAREPKSGHAKPAPAASPGGEKKADMKGAIGGSPTDGLSGAVSELKRQHPIAHHDHGPHHGTDHHIRHEPGKY